MPKKTLNNTFIKQVTYSGAKAFCDYSDNGLILRVSKHGVKSFRYQYRINSKRRTLTIGHYPDTSLKQARDAIIQAKADLKQGIDPMGARDAMKQAKNPIDVLTLGDALDRYLERYARYYQKQENYRWTERAFERLPQNIRKIALKDIKSVTISDYLESLHKTPATAIKLLKIIKTAFSWFYSKSYIEQNLIRDIKQPFKPVKRKRVLTDTELKAVLKACHELAYPQGDTTLILAYTGARKNEVCRMKWSELDLENALWTIPPERAKNETGHKVHLCPTVLNILKAIPKQKGDYVFSTTGGKIPMVHSTKIKEKINAMVGFSDWVIHDLRRTATTNLSAELKLPDIVVSSILNHSKAKVQGETSTYNQNTYFDECIIGLNRYGDFLDGLASGRYTDKVLPFKKS